MTNRTYRAAALALPIPWPERLIFCCRPLRTIANPSPTPQIGRVKPPAFIRFGPSPIHGTGGFAVVDIPAGSRIIEYTGERITKQESIARCAQGNHFIFYLDEDWDLDGSVASNPARFLNHACAPNADAERIDGRIWIVASRFIAAGEEITFDYHYDLDHYREHPCRCGAAECAGYIVAAGFREALRRQKEWVSPSHGTPGER
jgi:uncharacterized protein